MTGETPDDADDPDDETPPNGRPRAAFGFGFRDGIRAFADLLRALDDADERRGSGRVETDRTTVDYGVNVGLGPGPNEGDRSSRRDRAGRRPRVRRTNDRYRVTTRREDDEFVVTADLPGVDADELTVGFDDDRETLVVGVDGRAVERVGLPWPDPTSERSALRNGVLEVRLGRENPEEGRQ